LWERFSTAISSVDQHLLSWFKSFLFLIKPAGVLSGGWAGTWLTPET